MYFLYVYFSLWNLRLQKVQTFQSGKRYHRTSLTEMKKDFTDTFRHIVKTQFGMQPHDSISDRQIWAAAKDAYQTHQHRIAAYRKKNPETPEEWSQELKQFPDKVSQWADELSRRHHIQTLHMHIDNERLKLHQIIVAKPFRKRGYGSRALEEIVQMADLMGLRVELNLAVKNKMHGTTSQRRLARFYKRFGFVLNKGRYKDFRISAMMYRLPR